MGAHHAHLVKEEVHHAPLGVAICRAHLMEVVWGVHHAALVVVTCCAHLVEVVEVHHAALVMVTCHAHLVKEEVEVKVNPHAHLRVVACYAPLMVEVEVHHAPLGAAAHCACLMVVEHRALLAAENKGGENRQENKLMIIEMRQIIITLSCCLRLRRIGCLRTELLSGTPQKSLNAEYSSGHQNLRAQILSQWAAACTHVHTSIDPLYVGIVVVRGT